MTDRPDDDAAILQDRSLNSIDLSAFEQVARVSSRRGHAPRWTELGIYYRKNERKCFIAEIVGESKVAGEHRRSRRRVFSEIERCLEFFDAGMLNDQAREQAGLWYQHNRARVRADRNLNEIMRDRAGTLAAVGPSRIQGFAGQGLAAALDWLYPGTTPGAREAMMLKDFGIPKRTLLFSLAGEREGKPLTSWCQAWLSALRGFDRRSLAGDGS